MRATRLLGPILVLVLGTGAVLAQRGDDADRTSKNGKAEGTIDGVDIVLEYGRPNVRGRKIWGGLVPYGKVWRTGANEATTIAFSADVTVEGERLPAGTYGLFTIPGENEWVVIFNKVAHQWGAYEYDAGQDALRVTVRPTEAEHLETLDFFIASVSVVEEMRPYFVEGSVMLRWEKLAVSFKVAKAS